MHVYMYMHVYMHMHVYMYMYVHLLYRLLLEQLRLDAIECLGLGLLPDRRRLRIPRTCRK